MLRARHGVGLLLALSAGAAALSGAALLTAHAAHAQPAALGGSALRFERLGVEDGLSAGTVAAITQDRQGFLWFGTYSGLDRYDGHTFTHYGTVPFDSTSFQGGQINALTEARDGALWVGSTVGGVSRFDPATGRFRRYPYAPDDTTALVSGAVRGIYEDRTGAIWISTRHGLTRLDPATGRFRRFFHRSADPHSLTSDCVTSPVVQGADGALWVGSNNGLNRLDPATGRVTRFLHAPEGPQDCTTQAIHPVMLVEDLRVDPRAPGVLWFAGHGLARFDTRAGQATYFWPDSTRPAADPLNQTRVMAPDPYERGVFWITTPERGLLRFDARPGAFTRFRHDREDPHSLQSDEMKGIYADRTGAVWVGSFSGRG